MLQSRYECSILFFSNLVKFGVEVKIVLKYPGRFRLTEIIGMSY